MTQRIKRFFTWGITFPWPPSWPLFRLWRVPGDVPKEMAENERALEAARNVELRRRYGQ
jgi:hypothetical protein